MSARSRTFLPLLVIGVVLGAVVLAWAWVRATGDEPAPPGRTAVEAAAGSDSASDSAAGGDSAHGPDSDVDRDADPDAGGRGSTAPDGPPDRGDTGVDGVADSAAARFVRESSLALGPTGDSRAGVRETATGPALDAARAAAAEFADNGWHQVGTPRVTSSEVLARHPHASPPAIRIAACVDSSGVDVVDESGESVRTGTYAARSMMLFDLVRLHGDWLVRRQSFPDDPDC